MPNTSDEHHDRYSSPYKNFSLTSHSGKDLRLISMNHKRKFPDLPYHAKICVHCRRAKYKSDDADFQTSHNLLDVNQNHIDLHQNESFNSDSSTPPKVNNTAIVHSQKKN